MKYSFEVPTTALDVFYEDQDYLFCIAPTALSDYNYFNFYKEKAKEKYLVLDNGAFELGKSISIKELVQLAQDLGAREIVSPDVVHNAVHTVNKSIELFRYLDAKELLNDFEVMVVPQGKTKEEVMLCLSKLMRLPARVVGIAARVLPANTPYHSEQLRFSFLQEIIQKKMLGKRVVHLLGLCAVQYMKAYKKEQHTFKIRSIDTSFPIVLGMLGKSFTETKRKPTCPLLYDAVLTEETIKRIKFNINYLKNYK